MIVNKTWICLVRQAWQGFGEARVQKPFKLSSRLIHNPPKMSISSVKLEDTGSDQEQRTSAPLLNGPSSIPCVTLSDSSEVAVLREENCRLMTTLLEYKKTLENTKLRYGSVKKDYYAAKKRLKRLADKLGGESRESTPTSSVQPVIVAVSAGVAAPPVDDEVRKKWKEPNVKAAIKLKAAIGVAAYQSLIRDGELALPSLRTISRYVDALKRAGLKPNYDFNVRDDGTELAGGRMLDDEDDDDSRDVDHNRNQQHLGGGNKQLQQQQQQQSRDVSDAEDPVNFTAVPDINYYRGKMEVEDTDEIDDDDDQPELYHNGEGSNGGVEVYRPHPNQHTSQQQQQQTLTSGHIEFLKQMTGFRKKWTPFELRTCMDIRRIIGSKEYDSLRKNDGMPLPSAKTLRKYKHTVHLDGVDVMSRKRNFREMVDGVVPGMANGNGLNGIADDILNAEEPEGYFDINGLSEEQIDFLQSLSSNTKGFSDFELQKTLELKNELGGHNYEILRKQELLHVPTLSMLKKYEQENGLEDLSAMVVVEDVDEEDDQEPEQEAEHDPEFDNEFPFPPDHFGMNGGGTGGVGEDSHMGIFEHHSIFEKDDASTMFDMGKLSQHHVEFLNTLPENPKRWTTAMINSALDIKNEIGTRDYELLRRQGIPLPAARTLRRHKDIKTRVGVEGE